MDVKGPKIIEEVEVDFDWDEKKLWALNIPETEMPISELEWHFEIPFWDSHNGYYNLTPNEVLADPEKYKDEYKRVETADLQYPLDVMFYKNRWVLLDGLHRLVKAKLMGMKQVRVKMIPEKDIPLIKIDS